ncbi:MAG TPA: hypothetical protein GXX19_08920 [Syntrophomonadaceae bacterium]|nr:hypothetical protein [Syntrophomonadaceae bacterium]
MKVLKTVDPQEQREVEELIQQQKRLHIAPSPVVYLTAEVQTLDGEPLARYEDRSRSWVRNYYNWMATQTLARGAEALGNTYGAGTLVMKDISGSVQGYSEICYHVYNSNEYTFNEGMRGASGNTNIGIVVGTGTGPENFDAYKLTTLIPHGTATGQLQYQEMGPGTLSWDSVGKKFVQVLERIFINNSGGTITVGEAGIYAKIRASSAYYYSFLIARDVLSPAIEVPNSSQLKVTYTIELALPA